LVGRKMARRGVKAYDYETKEAGSEVTRDPMIAESEIIDGENGKDSLAEPFGVKEVDGAVW